MGQEKWNWSFVGKDKAVIKEHRWIMWHPRGTIHRVMINHNNTNNIIPSNPMAGNDIIYAMKESIPLISPLFRCLDLYAEFDISDLIADAAPLFFFFAAFVSSTLPITYTTLHKAHAFPSSFPFSFSFYFLYIYFSTPMPTFCFIFLLSNNIFIIVNHSYPRYSCNI